MFDPMTDWVCGLCGGENTNRDAVCVYCQLCELHRSRMHEIAADMLVSYCVWIIIALAGLAVAWSCF